MNTSYSNPCLVCEEKRVDKFRIYYDGFIKLFRCGSCGFVGHYPGPGQHGFPDYTAFFKNSGLPSDAEFYPPAHVPNFKDILARIARFMPPPGRLLDVGCFGGHFLLAAREGGYEVEGVEAADAVAHYVRRKTGLRITTGLYTPELLEPAQFDVITMMHVFEHVLDPAELFKAARVHLRQGGLLAIDVPSLWNPVMLLYGRTRLRGLVENRMSGLSAVLPQHYAYYQPATLRQALKRHGWEVVHLATGRYSVKYGVGHPLMSRLFRIVDRLCERYQIGTIFVLARVASTSSGS